MDRAGGGAADLAGTYVENGEIIVLEKRIAAGDVTTDIGRQSIGIVGGLLRESQRCQLFLLGGLHLFRRLPQGDRARDK